MKVSFEDEDGEAEGPLTSDAYPSSGTVMAAGGTNTAPVFANDTTSRSFTETVGDAEVVDQGEVGAAVTATDADGDTLTYSLEGTDAAKFGIDSGSGQIQTKVGEKYVPGGQDELFGDGEGRRQQRRLGHDRGDDQR